MLDREFHFMILRCFQMSNQLIMKDVNKLDLFSGQPKILEYLLENDGSKSIEIAKGCSLDKSTVASLLIRMEQMNLIKRIQHENDGRCLNIYLTEKGKNKALQVKEIVKKVDECAMNNIPENKKEEFLHTLDMIMLNLFNNK